MIHVSLVSPKGDALLVLDSVPCGFGYRKEEERCPPRCAAASRSSRLEQMVALAARCSRLRLREDAHTCSDKEAVMSGLHGLFPSVWEMSTPASFFLAAVTILHPIKTGCKTSVDFNVLRDQALIKSCKEH